MYDLKSDPFCMTNVAADEERALARRRLSDQLMLILTETPDPRVLGDGSSFDKPPFAGTSQPQ